MARRPAGRNRRRYSGSVTSRSLTPPFLRTVRRLLPLLLLPLAVVAPVRPAHACVDPCLKPLLAPEGAVPEGLPGLALQPPFDITGPTPEPLTDGTVVLLRDGTEVAFAS